MHDLPLITTVAAAFVAAWVLGIITQKLRFSPIVGYLLAGIAIGPHTPGFVGDATLASQLAEIGIVLLMFGVGLHFRLEDLLAVRKVAVPGAIGQSLITTLLGVAVAVAFGMTVKSGLVMGVALAVASTVVLTRVLTDNKMLDTLHGHVAVGWLIVEDILTVVVLVLIPALGTSPGDTPHASLWIALPWALVKLSALVTLLLVAGGKIIPWMMVRVARLRSRELFTLTVLVMAVSIAAGSSYVFGASTALGAFLAGMVVGRSPVSQQAAADALPLRDAFAVLFFVSVGMLFDPAFVVHRPGLMAAGLAIVLIAKPIAALILVALVGYPGRTAITVALGLAQVGEFSFILSELGRSHGLLNEDGHNLLVACALVSITVNPLLFRQIGFFERLFQYWPALWSIMNRGITRRQGFMNEMTEKILVGPENPMAVIIGYGPVGRAVDAVLRQLSLETLIVDINIDTIEALHRQNRAAIYGDAFNIEVIAQVLPRATHLVVTLPHSANRGPLIVSAKQLNPKTKVFVRARYIAEREELMQAGTDAACYEEAEASVALARLVLTDVGADDQAIGREIVKIRQQYQAVLPT